MTGGCLCGAVRYEITVDPIFGGRCYCTDCRKGGSTGHSTVMATPAAGFQVTGEETAFTKPGDSGLPITRYFCSSCGTTTHSSPEAMKGVFFVRASTLDDPEQFMNGASIYVSRAPSWDTPPADQPAFPEMPPPPEH
jgi:hypothetical protein